MINTRLITHDFQYTAATRLSEAIALLKQHGSQAMILAGGTDVVPQLKYRLVKPALLIDIKSIDALERIDAQNGLVIGGTAKLGRVEAYCATTPDYACLYDALRSIGKIQVMNMGTIAGNLCTASPAADSAPALLVLDARVVLKGPEGERVVKLKRFFKGPRRTVKADNEIMTAIHIPPVASPSGSAFRKMARVGSDISKITCAVFVERRGERCRRLRIAMGSAAPMPLRITEIEKRFENTLVDDQFLADIKNNISKYINPISDIRSSDTYKKQVAGCLFGDTFQKAWDRAGESQ